MEIKSIKLNVVPAADYLLSDLKSHYADIPISISAQRTNSHAAVYLEEASPSPGESTDNDMLRGTVPDCLKPLIEAAAKYSRAEHGFLREAFRSIQQGDLSGQGFLQGHQKSGMSSQQAAQIKPPLFSADISVKNVTTGTDKDFKLFIHGSCTGLPGFFSTELELYNQVIVSVYDSATSACFSTAINISRTR